MVFKQPEHKQVQYESAILLNFASIQFLVFLTWDAEDVEKRSKHWTHGFSSSLDLCLHRKQPYLTHAVVCQEGQIFELQQRTVTCFKSSLSTAKVYSTVGSLNNGSSYAPTWSCINDKWSNLSRNCCQKVNCVCWPWHLSVTLLTHCKSNFTGLKLLIEICIW